MDGHSLSSRLPQRITSSHLTERLAPAVALFLLAPFIGQFLPGTLPITWLWALPVMAAVYGAGALVIRETARRLNLGWPSILVLGLGYAIVVGTFVTQSLFDPTYPGPALFGYGAVPTLESGLRWPVYVLGVQAVWSTAVPIAVTEYLVPERRRTPWLGRAGFVLLGLVFVSGCVGLFVLLGRDGFAASPAQLLGSLVLVLALAILAIGMGPIEPPSDPADRRPPEPRQIGVTSFALGSVVVALPFAIDVLPASVNAAATLAAFVAGAALLRYWSDAAGWSVRHGFAATAGLVLTYCWFGFVRIPTVGGTDPIVDLLGNAIFAAGAVGLLWTTQDRLDAYVGAAEASELDLS